MPKTRIAVTLDGNLIGRVDGWSKLRGLRAAAVRESAA